MNVDLQPASYWYVETVSNEDECQQICETETNCKVVVLIWHFLKSRMNVLLQDFHHQI